MSQPKGSPPRERPSRDRPMLVAMAIALASASGSVISNRVSGWTWIFYLCLGVLSLAGVFLGGWALWVWLARRGIGPGPEPIVSAQPASFTTLPYLSGFIGRADEVESITTLVSREHAVAVVGRRGVGTSSCAVSAAHRFAGVASQRVLYLNLRTAAGARGSRDVLIALAQAVKVTPPKSGGRATLAVAAAQIMAKLNDKRNMLVLDNVDNLAQVRALFPPTTECHILLAGTPRLDNLRGVAVRSIKEPDVDDAMALFAATPSVNADDRDQDVRSLVELCARQPLTIRSLDHWMDGRGMRVSWVLTDLRQVLGTPAYQKVTPPDVLRVLTARDPAYRALSRPARRLVRLMALVGQPLDRAAMTALVGWRTARLATVLDELIVDRFLEGYPDRENPGHPDQRYWVRPLLSAYTRLRVLAGAPRWRVAAQARLLRYLARSAERQLTRLATGAVGAPLGPGSPRQPHGWLSTHAPLMHAMVLAIPGQPAQAGQPRRLRRWWLRTAMALCGWYARENEYSKWQQICEAVQAVPDSDRHTNISSWAHNELGVLYRRQGDPVKAEAEFIHALRRRGWRTTAQAEHNLGLALLDQKRADEAVACLQMARRRRSRADRAGHALTALALGAAHLARERPVEAHGHLVRAANVFHALGDRRGYAAALTNLTLAQWQRGNHMDAELFWPIALAEYDQLGDAVGRASALLAAGAARLAAVSSDDEQARSWAEQAWELLGEGLRLRDGHSESPGLGRTHLYRGDAAQRLGDAAHQLGDAAQARNYWQQAQKHWQHARRICVATKDEPGAQAARNRLTLPGGRL